MALAYTSPTWPASAAVSVGLGVSILSDVAVVADHRRVGSEGRICEAQATPRWR